MHDAVAMPNRTAPVLRRRWQRYGFENLGKCLAFVVKLRLCEYFEQRPGHLPKFCPPTPPRST